LGGGNAFCYWPPVLLGFLGELGWDVGSLGLVMVMVSGGDVTNWVGDVARFRWDGN